MNPTDERRAALRGVDFLPTLEVGGIDALLQCLTERRLGAGEDLYRQGDAGDSMAIVVAGELVVRLRKQDGSEMELRSLGPAEVLGEMACIDPAPRGATVAAVQATTVYELSRDGLLALERFAPAVSAAVVGAVIREVTRRLRDLEARTDREFGEAPGEQRASARPAQVTQPADRPSALPPESGEAPRSGFWRLVDRLRGAG